MSSTKIVFKFVAVSIVALFFTSLAAAQQYTIQRAEYGADVRWVDVTQELRRLAAADARFRMGNSTFGVDPAPGVVKTLRIFAWGPNGDSRVFEYREGRTVDGSIFSEWGGGDWGRPGSGEFTILRAEYGADNRWVDVTQRLRQLAASDQTFRMGNSTFGVDPAPGVVKMLRIFARGPRGRTRTFEYREGSTVDGSMFSGWGGGNWGGGGGGWDNDEGQYVIQRAEYGADRRWVDVTDQLRRIAANDTRFRMGNSTFGVDPAPGVVKTLKIYARSRRGDSRTFTYREGSTVDGSIFSGWRGGNWGGGGGGNWGGGGWNNSLQIVQAYYGANNRRQDVTRRLQEEVRNGSLRMSVNNASMGVGDPAPGVPKELTVVYRYNGRVRTATVREGSDLNLPQ